MTSFDLSKNYYRDELLSGRFNGLPLRISDLAEEKIVVFKTWKRRGRLPKIRKRVFYKPCAYIVKLPAHGSYLLDFSQDTLIMHPALYDSLKDHFKSCQEI